MCLRLASFLLSTGPMCLLFTYLLIFLFPQSRGYSVSEQDKIKFLMRIVHFLLPWLKQFHQEQVQEKSAEAATKGSMIATCPNFSRSAIQQVLYVQKSLAGSWRDTKHYQGYG